MNFKLLILGTTLSLFANFALAKHGNGGGDKPNRPTRGSAAWFISETAEHGAMGLVAKTLINQDSPTFLNAELTDSANAVLTIGSTEGEVAENCRMQDHYSHSGTVLKKEVYCDNSPYYSANSKLIRGTNLWALVEGIENSIRQLYMSDKGSQNVLTAAFSSLSGNLISVELFKGETEVIKFQCLKANHLSHSGTISKIDVNCSPL
jgi:hypothetical protein